MGKSVKVTRQELFDQVWAEPVSRVAERYGLSGTWVRRTCLENDVPVPPRGYWARVAAGQNPKKLRLPKPSAANEIVTLQSAFGNAGNREALQDNREAERSDAVKEQKAFEADPANKIVIREDEQSKHSWAREVEKRLRQRRRHLSSEEDPVHATVEGDALSVSVSPPLFERTILIVDAIAKASVARGFLPSRRKGGEILRVTAEGVPLRLELKEKRDRFELPKPKPPKTAFERLTAEYGPRFGYRPTGILQVRISSDSGGSETSRTFTDTTTHKVEDRLNDAMVAFVQVALRHRAREERLRREREAWEAERRRREEEWRRREEEAARLRKLEELALQWERAQRLRRFISNANERGAFPLIDGGPTSLEAWSRWATAWADRLDPLGQG